MTNPNKTAPVGHELPVVAYIAETGATVSAKKLSEETFDRLSESLMQDWRNSRTKRPLVLQSAHVEAMAGLRVEKDRLRSALQALANMYSHAWDSKDGSLVMLSPSVPEFERVHQDARDILNQEPQS